jgi:small-conductance mechanosensitive channel
MPNTHLPDAKTILDLTQMALWAFGIIAVGFTSMGIVAFLRTENPAGSFSKLFERLQILKMATVMLVIITTTYLSLFGVIDSTGAVGIFSGVAGYVLGGLEKKPAETPTAAGPDTAGSEGTQP